MSLATFFNWTSVIVISLVTPTMLGDPGLSITCYIYAGSCGLAFLVILLFLKETFGKNDIEIYMLYMPRRGTKFLLDSTHDTRDKSGISAM